MEKPEEFVGPGPYHFRGRAHLRRECAVAAWPRAGHRPKKGIAVRVYRALQFGGALALEDVPAPEPGRGEVRLAVKAAGVHLADAALLTGERRPQPKLPFTPGMEAAGIVTAIGESVTGLAVGDAVAVLLSAGGLAEEAVADAALCVKVPKALPLERAACLPLAYAGALAALRDKAHLARGETLLVLGAGGQLGLGAIVIGKRLGARVIAAAGSEERRAAAKAQGADEIVDASSASLSESVKSLTDGRGADVVFDPVGGDGFDAALTACAIGARYISAGFAAGRVPRVDLQSLHARGLDLLTANITALQNIESMQTALRDVVIWAADGSIQPRIAARFKFSEASHALEYVKSRRDTGAVIVVPD